MTITTINVVLLNQDSVRLTENLQASSKQTIQMTWEHCWSSDNYRNSAQKLNDDSKQCQ